jgi:hypothetical protein
MIAFATSIKYMFAGYTVILTVLAFYIVSLFFRWRNLKRDLHTLHEIQKKSL